MISFPIEMVSSHVFVEDTLKDGILCGPLHITLRENIISLQLRVSHRLLEGYLKNLTGIFRVMDLRSCLFCVTL
jgi:hypothetical protein